MSDISQVKAFLRAEKLALRKAIPEQQKIAFETEIAKKFFAHFQLKPHSIMAGFYPTKTECSPLMILSTLLELSHKITLPTIENERMMFKQVQSLEKTQLILHHHKFYEPPAHAEALTPEIILLPLVAFDETKNRLGRGGGFYDRALAQIHQNGYNPVTIGIAFECQKTQQIPVEVHDQPMDYIITEAAIYE